jgi:hypothetical protein
MSSVRANRKGTHSVLRRTLGILLIILGLASAGLGVASATVWRESDSVVSTATPKGDGTLVVTDPGVLELVGSDVTVVATVPDGGKVTVAIGRDIDVEGWVGIDHSTRIHGLSDWTTLTSSAVEPEIPAPAEGEEAPVPGVGADPAGNDMWVAEATGEGSVSLRWTDRPGRWSMLAAGVGEGAVAPTIELTWPREVTTPFLWPAVGAGAALVLAGLLLLLLRRRAPRPASGHATPDEPTVPSADRPASATSDDSVQDSAAPRLAGRWPVATVTAPGAAPAPATANQATPAPDAEAGEAGEAGEAEQRPARAALGSRRSRRRAAEAASGTEAPAASPAEAPAAPAAEAPAAPLAETGAPAAAEQAAPAGRRWGFSPVFGGSAAPAEPTPQPSPGPAPEPPAAPQAASPAPAPAASEPPTSTGALRLTRRELRAQEEARRAAEQTGIAGRLRALTGAVPAVRPAPPPLPTPDPAAPPTRASRAQAWREAWGFDPDAGGQTPTDGDGQGGAR